MRAEGDAFGSVYRLSVLTCNSKTIASIDLIFLYNMYYMGIGQIRRHIGDAN